MKAILTKMRKENKEVMYQSRVFAKVDANDLHYTLAEKETHDWKVSHLKMDYNSVSRQIINIKVSDLLRKSIKL